MNAPSPSLAKFPLGSIVATPNALSRISHDDIVAGIQRHQAGDWGDVPEADKKENELSLEQGYRLFSAYASAEGVAFWIITEADRSVTTVLLPEDY